MDGATQYIPEEEKRPHTALGGIQALWYTGRRYLKSDSCEGLSIASLSILSIIQIKTVELRQQKQKPCFCRKCKNRAYR